MPHDVSVAAQLAQLPNLSMPEIWALWDKHFEQRPRHSNRFYIESRLAYKIQVSVYGELPRAKQRALERIGEAGTTTRQDRGRKVVPGTVLVREYDGAEHRVVANLDGTCEYAGKTYSSLSAVARVITGTRWNGHRFFGLRKEKR